MFRFATLSTEMFSAYSCCPSQIYSTVHTQALVLFSTHAHTNISLYLSPWENICLPLIAFISLSSNSSVKQTNILKQHLEIIFSCQTSDFQTGSHKNRGTNTQTPHHTDRVASSIFGWLSTSSSEWFHRCGMCVCKRIYVQAGNRAYHSR